MSSLPGSYSLSVTHSHDISLNTIFLCIALLLGLITMTGLSEAVVYEEFRLRDFGEVDLSMNARLF